MLAQYRKQANMAGAVLLATFALIFVLPTFVLHSATADAWQQHPAYKLLGYVFMGAFCFSIWALARAKGYSGWVGLGLAIFNIIGIAILLSLKDKHADTEPQKTLDGKECIRPNVTTSAVHTPSNSLDNRLDQLQGLRERGVITDEEYKTRRDKLLDEI